jgi:hypothetical protein
VRGALSGEGGGRGERKKRCRGIYLFGFSDGQLLHSAIESVKGREERQNTPDVGGGVPPCVSLQYGCCTRAHDVRRAVLRSSLLPSYPPAPHICRSHTHVSSTRTTKSFGFPPPTHLLRHHRSQLIPPPHPHTHTHAQKSPAPSPRDQRGPPRVSGRRRRRRRRRGDAAATRRAGYHFHNVYFVQSQTTS